MKSAKPQPADASSQRRSQPLRQTRTNPPRSSANVARSGGGRDSIAGRPSGDQPIDIFPAITHFADAMTALPKELVRHFTLLKEVDAKIFSPEEQLFQLVATAAALPDPSNSTAPTSVAMTAQNSSSGAPPFIGALSMGSVEDLQAISSAVFEPSNLHRRQHFRTTAFKVQEMLVALEEKNHVLSTANDALQRQLARVDDVWPYVMGEFSDEAKWGSTNHWAYPENRSNKLSQAERARRDGAAAISAAAQVLVDEAAARSDARKQAVQAKKSQKNQNADNDHDDNEGRPREVGKKSQQSKSRKAAEVSGVGLGITTPGSGNGNPAPKRRKVEKTANGGAPMERAMSSVFGGTASKGKASSPQLPAAPEGPKKRKALPSSSGQAKKRNALPGAPTSAPSTPTITELPEPKITNRASPALPAPTTSTTTSTPKTVSTPAIPPVVASPVIPSAPTPTAPRPPSARARQNSIQSLADAANARPLSTASIKANGNGATSTVAEPVSALNPPPKMGTEAKPTTKEKPVPSKPEPIKSEMDGVAGSASAPPMPVPKPEPKPEEPERRMSESAPPPALQAPPLVTTKSGRASKPSTPALATFQEAARPRSSRNAESGSSSKKGHRKSNSVVVQPLAPMAAPQQPNNPYGGPDDDDADIDADEPTYCYCNSVSYGEMVACDASGCQREWFHLACVGLKVAPGSKTKWYCEDCKERLKLGGKKINGR